MRGGRSRFQSKYGFTTTEPVDLVQVELALLAVLVEQAELYPVGYLGEQGKVRPRPVIGGPERVAVARPYGGRRQVLSHPSLWTRAPIITHLPIPGTITQNHPGRRPGGEVAATQRPGHHRSG